MQYLQQNKVNYYNYSSNSNIIFSNGVESLNADQAYIIFSEHNENNNNYNSTFYQCTYATQANRTSFTIYSSSILRYMNDVMFVIRPSFTCSDITIITGNITFKVSYTNTDDITTAKEYKLPLKKQFMNTYNLYDILQVNDTIKSFTISATSDINLTLPQPNIMVDDHNNFANVTVLYL